MVWDRDHREVSLSKILMRISLTFSHSTFLFSPVIKWWKFSLKKNIPFLRNSSEIVSVSFHVLVSKLENAWTNSRSRLENWNKLLVGHWSVGLVGIVSMGGSTVSGKIRLSGLQPPDPLMASKLPLWLLSVLFLISVLRCLAFRFRLTGEWNGTQEHTLETDKSVGKETEICNALEHY